MRFSIPYSQATDIGKREDQLDRVIVSEEDYGFFAAVADGHGGVETVDIINEHLHDTFRTYSRLFGPLTGMKKAFKELNTTTAFREPGSTISAVWINKGNSRKLPIATIGVIGDSPVLVQNSVETPWFAPMHNVRLNLSERTDAEKKGAAYNCGYLFRPGLRGGIQLSRTLGDASFSNILNREGEFITRELPLGAIVLIASDGLFPKQDEMADAGRSYMKLIREGADAQALIKHVLEQHKSDDKLDNMSVVACQIHE